MVSFTVNGRAVSVDADPATPLLWVIRDHIGLTGTKYGCGAGLCGACTVHVDGRRVRSCQTRCRHGRRQEGRHHRRPVAQLLASAAEGLGRRAGAAMRLLPVRPDHEGRGAAGRESEARRATQIVEHMDGNICRCGTYHRIIAAIQRASREGLSHDHASTRSFSRRGVLAGLGGIAFCLAVGNDGVRLMSQAQADAMANAQMTPWVRIAPGRPHHDPHRRRRDGPGLDDRPAAHRRGRDGCRLVEGARSNGRPPTCQGLRLQGSVRHRALMWIVGSRAMQLYFNQCGRPARRCARC